MVAIPDISITGFAPRDTSAAYYAAFRRRYGFADSEMRGTHDRVVLVQPLGDYLDGGCVADKYAPNGRPGRPAISKLRSGDHAGDVLGRAVGSAALLNEIRHLLGHLRPRLVHRPNLAIRDAVADAENVLRGLDPVAKGHDKVDVLRSLVRVLSRYA